jgi:hypothetical protein
LAGQGAHALCSDAQEYLTACRVRIGAASAAARGGADGASTDALAVPLIGGR